MQINFIKLFFIPLFIFVFCLPSVSSATTVREQQLQMTQILTRELSILKNLMASLSSALERPSEISGTAYIAVDISDNHVLLEKDTSSQYSIASITKLMNTVVARENIKPTTKITLSSKMLKPSGSSPAIYKGLSISAKSLMSASLTQSVNDAAESLSYFLGNATYVAKMNQKAKALGMNDTVFIDANGLNPNNKSTATDLVKLITYVYKNHPELLATTKDNNFWLPDKTGKLVKFYNENYFYYLPNFIGGKTGYLPEANQTLASLFTINGKQIAIIVLNSTNIVGDTLNIVTNIEKNF